MTWSYVDVISMEMSIVRPAKVTISDFLEVPAHYLEVPR